MTWLAVVRNASASGLAVAGTVLLGLIPWVKRQSQRRPAATRVS